MKRFLHIVFKFAFWVAVIAVLPIYCARAFDLDVLTFLVIWDFFALLLFVGASEKKSSVKPLIPKPIFPWWGF